MTSSDTQAPLQFVLPRRLFYSFATCLLGMIANPSHAEEEASAPRWSVHGYATWNYQHFEWESDKKRRSSVDMERLAIESSVRLAEGYQWLAELEIEHGGTGSALEFDNQEEFGEFENEIEKGGEVVLEQCELRIRLSPTWVLQVGHLFVPVGLNASLDEPGDYFTVMRGEGESVLLPTLWHETGLGLMTRHGEWNFQTVLVNGLDPTGFSSAHWIAPGHQGRFETVNAEGFALAFRSEWMRDESLVGASIYGGNTQDNRPKPDLHVPAWLGLYEFHARLEAGAMRFSGLWLHGGLQNAAAISQANRQLPSALGVKRNAVGAQAYAGMLEMGIDCWQTFHHGIQSLHIDDATALWVFARYDAYDTMLRNDGMIVDNPRWQRQAFTLGFNFLPISSIVWKGEGHLLCNGDSEANQDWTWSTGLGMAF